MSEANDHGLELLFPEWPAPGGVRAFATTREGGCSDAPYRSLNLAFHVGDRAADVEANRQRLNARLELAGGPCWLNQVHGSRVVAAEEGLGREADASYTQRVDTPCVVMVADCVPILLCDRRGTQVGAAHAGWRGLAEGVIDSVVASFPDPAELLAWLGPAIGPCHYEVGDEVKAAFAPDATGFSPASDAGHWMLDLYAIARAQLAAAGVRQVFGGDLCTHCDERRFYSHRRDGTTGRIAALIWIAAD